MDAGAWTAGNQPPASTHTHAGILKGARREHLAQAGSAVELRPGALAVMRKALDAGVAV